MFTNDSKMSTMRNSDDSGEMPHNAAFHQGLHYMPFAKIDNLQRKKYSKTCVKRPIKNRQSNDLNEKW